MNAIATLTVTALLTLMLGTAAAQAAVYCDEDGCRRIVEVPGPVYAPADDYK